MNNVRTVTSKKEPTPKSLGSRLCGISCSVGSSIKSGICAFIPSLATVKFLILTLIITAMPVFLTEMCTKNKCTVMEMPVMPRKFQVYYDPLSIALVAGFLVTQLLLYLIPLGKVVKPKNGATVHCNGIIALLVSVAVLSSLMYFGYDVLQVYTKYRQLLATSMALSMVLTLAVYIRARYIPDDAKNPVGNSGMFLPDFFTGRELNPAVRSLDLKFLLFRVALLTWIMINVLVVMKDLRANPGQYSPTLLTACGLQIFYAVDYLWFEDSYFTTYDYMRQGCGLLFILGHLTGPFIVTVFTRFILNHGTELEWYYLSLIVALNLVGYTILRGSNSQKHSFRSNPSDPALAYLESLPTPAGTRLLVSGWWGFLRHPNYLGDLLTFISWGLLCGFRHALPWILVGIDVLFLVGRIFEVESVCKKKYGTAWNSYTERVKYRLIPKIF